MCGGEGIGMEVRWGCGVDVGRVKKWVRNEVVGVGVVVNSRVNMLARDLKSLWDININRMACKHINI